jgi:hypothetical protein
MVLLFQGQTMLRDDLRPQTLHASTTFFHSLIVVIVTLLQRSVGANHGRQAGPVGRRHIEPGSGRTR